MSRHWREPIEPLGALCADAARCRRGLAGDRTGAWVTLTVAGLTMGIMLFMVASGLTLIFGLMDVLNFAHAAFVTVGAYIAVTVLRAARRLDQRSLRLTLNLAALLVALGCRRRCQRRARLCLRARHHSPGLWCAAAPDPDHDRRSDRHRAIDHRDLGAAGHRRCRSRHAARQRFHRIVVDRNLSAVRAVRRPGGRRWRCISFSRALASDWWCAPASRIAR